MRRQRRPATKPAVASPSGTLVDLAAGAGHRPQDLVLQSLHPFIALAQNAQAAGRTAGDPVIASLG